MNNKLKRILKLFLPLEIIIISVPMAFGLKTISNMIVPDSLNATSSVLMTAAILNLLVGLLWMLVFVGMVIFIPWLIIGLILILKKKPAINQKI